MDFYLTNVIVFILFSSTMVLSVPSNECRNASDHCHAEFMQTVQQQQASMAAICSGARRSLSCVQDLACDSEVPMRMAIRVANRELYKKNIQSCELGIIFPADTLYTRECQQKKQTCMNAYIDDLLNHTANATNQTNHPNDANTLCQDLNTFASCKMKSDNCVLKKEEVEKIINQEKTRLTVPYCTVHAISKGTTHLLSLLLWLSTALAAVVYAN